MSLKGANVIYTYTFIRHVGYRINRFGNGHIAVVVEINRLKNKLQINMALSLLFPISETSNFTFTGM